MWNHKNPVPDTPMLVARYISKECIFMSFICQKLFLFAKFEVNFHVLTPLYTPIIVYRLNFLGKSSKWLWLYCFSYSYYTYLLAFFESCKQKKSFKHKSIGRRCFQLKVLKVLLMNVFVTLFIDKMTGSDNQLFLFNIHWKMKRRRSF